MINVTKFSYERFVTSSDQCERFVTCPKQVGHMPSSRMLGEETRDSADDSDADSEARLWRKWERTSARHHTLRDRN